MATTTKTTATTTATTGSLLPAAPARAVASASTLPARPRSGLSLVRVKDDLWRATVADGRILGHIERRDDVDGPMFIAKRLVPAQARFHTLGEFWEIDDAMDCLHSL